MAPKCALCLHKILTFYGLEVWSLEEDGGKYPKLLRKNVGWVDQFVFVFLL